MASFAWAGQDDFDDFGSDFGDFEGNLEQAAGRKPLVLHHVSSFD